MISDTTKLIDRMLEAGREQERRRAALISPWPTYAVHADTVVKCSPGRCTVFRGKAMTDMCWLRDGGYGWFASPVAEWYMLGTVALVAHEGAMP